MLILNYKIGLSKRPYQAKQHTVVT